MGGWSRALAVAGLRSSGQVSSRELRLDCWRWRGQAQRASPCAHAQGCIRRGGHLPFQVLDASAIEGIRGLAGESSSIYSCIQIYKALTPTLPPPPSVSRRDGSSLNPLGTEGAEAKICLSATNIGREEGGGKGVSRGLGYPPPPPPTVYGRPSTSIWGGGGGLTRCIHH